MTVQQAAFSLLTEAGHPLSSRELAKQMLDRKMVASASSDPVFSLSTTLDKNIRDGIYNQPKLVNVRDDKGKRLIALPAWDGQVANTRESKSTTTTSLSVTISNDLIEQVRLAQQAGIGSTLDDAIVELVRRGLASASGEIRSGVLKKLDRLGR